MIAEAAGLARSGPPKRVARAAKAALPVPDDLMAAIDAEVGARAVWDGFSPSHRREYIEWIIGAKRDETRVRRIMKAAQQVAEGKDQNWKYR
jgi:uncharacterized protein YdeI (YjbR/CyaY-like superfamily)